MTRYVTEIGEPNREPAELQVMHSYPKREDRSMTQRIAWQPGRAELDEMTSRTAKAMADPDASLLDRLRAAELEQLVHNQYLRKPGADAELQRDAEAEWEAGQ